MGGIMQAHKSYKRIRNIYDPLSTTPFKISRSKLDLFLKCPRCFYIDRRLGIGHPECFPYTLNNAVDELLKKEFDTYRSQQKPHPLFIENNIDAVPFDHPDIDKWRDSLHHGIQYLVPNTNINLTGGIDDILLNQNNDLIIIADYKATSTKNEISLTNRESYKRQMEIYQWLFRKNGFNVSNTGYFVYCNGKKDANGFDKQLQFDISLLSYTGDDSWVDLAVIKAYECLQSDTIPSHCDECDYCQYVKAISEVLQG